MRVKWTRMRKIIHKNRTEIFPCLRNNLKTIVGCSIADCGLGIATIRRQNCFTKSCAFVLLNEQMCNVSPIIEP